MGTGRMPALIIRRDRVLASGWIGFLVLLVVGTAAQYDKLFPTAAERAEFVAEVGDNAALRAFTGALHGDGRGNLLVWKVGDIAFSLLGVAALMTVVRHTRADEEAGRTELLAAGVLGRFAPATAALIAGSTASLLVGRLGAAGAAGLGADGVGAVAFGLALAAPGCVMTGVAAVADTFLWVIVVSVGMVATLYPMLTVLRLRSEETSGRADLTLATAISRRSWAVSHVAVAGGGSLVMLAVAGLAAGLVHGLMVDDVAGQLPRLLQATLVQVPAVWVTGAVAVLLIGAAPRLAAVSVWVTFGLVNLFGESLGPILGLDNTVADRAVPFHYVPKVLTGDDFAPTPLAVLALLAALVSALGLAALRRRHLT